MTSPRARSLRRVRPVVPLVFPSSEPEDERMPESKAHHQLREAFYDVLRRAAGPDHTTASDVFVYFDKTDPHRKLAPDALAKIGVPEHDFSSYRTWAEGGPPTLCVEILSPSDSPERWTFEEKLDRYRALGVQELVVFHRDGSPGSRLRVWDLIDDDLVERIVDGELTPCLSLEMTLVVAPVAGHPAGLRLARDPRGKDLVLTTEEERAVAEDKLREEASARSAAEDKLREEVAARSVAEDKLREAERELAELKARARADGGRE